MNILFDFDGTICDSLDELIAFGNQLLSKTNKPLLTKKEIRTLGIRHAIRSRKISKISLIIFTLLSRKRLESEIDTLDIFPTLPTVIKKLSKNHTLGIITSNSVTNVQKFLDHHKIQSHFSFIESSLALFGKHKKISKVIKQHHYAREDTVYIGDETRDVVAARKAGIASIAVTWGFESRSLLAKSRPDQIISKAKEIYQSIS